MSCYYNSIVCIIVSEINYDDDDDDEVRLHF